MFRQVDETINATRGKDAPVLMSERNLKLHRSNRGVSDHLSIWESSSMFPRKMAKCFAANILGEEFKPLEKKTVVGIAP
jgi:hypothetical protein